MREITVEEFYAIPCLSNTMMHYLEWCKTKPFSEKRAVVLLPDEFPTDTGGNPVTDGLASRLQTSIRYLFGDNCRLLTRKFPDGSVALLVAKKDMTTNATPGRPRRSKTALARSGIRT